MHCRAVIALVASAALAGCSSGGGVSTASILGTAPTPPPAADASAAGQPAVAAPIAPQSSPTDRAFQVGSVSARAVKCGYNFDPARLKASYIAHEIGLGATNDEVARIEKIYGVAYNGVTKAAAEDANYCAARKTAEIKEDLGRLLAGDFEPRRKAVVAKKDDGGFFSGWFDGSSQESGPSFGSGDWWEKQAEKAGQ